MEMGIEDELKRQGYELEYESSDGEDRKQVWVNEKLGMAVRIEWMRMDGEGMHRRILSSACSADRGAWQTSEL